MKFKEYRWGQEIVRIVALYASGGNAVAETRAGERLCARLDDLRPLVPPPEHRADVRPGPRTL